MNEQKRKKNRNLYCIYMQAVCIVQTDFMKKKVKKRKKK